MKKGIRLNQFGAIESIRPRFQAEIDGIAFTWLENGNQHTRFMPMSADEHIGLIKSLQESLLRRSMYDGFMRRQSNVK